MKSCILEAPTTQYERSHMKELQGNGSTISIAQAIEKIKQEQGNSFSIEKMNLAQLERLTGVTRSKLRTMKKNGFREAGDEKENIKITKLTGYTGIIDSLLKNGVHNSVIIQEHLKEAGFSGGNTIVKDYIRAHRYLIPVKRQQADLQGNRGRRYTSAPGASYQMDWGFAEVTQDNGEVSQIACFAMICHHCGERYIEFFPNARQEKLFIGMIHAFMYMGVPESVLTDNMKSVIVRRDLHGHPMWQKDYEAFMKEFSFATRLCKPRHPFTKGAVERLVRFIKENFLVGRVFRDMSDLNRQALEWCNTQNTIYHKAVCGIPEELHNGHCAEHLNTLTVTDAVMQYLCPLREISFDGFIEYDGHRYGVPFSYTGKRVRVKQDDDTIFIYSDDLKSRLTTHTVTENRADSYCKHQFEETSQPEESPTMPVTAQIRQVTKTTSGLSFEKFNFDKEDED